MSALARTPDFKSDVVPLPKSAKNGSEPALFNHLVGKPEQRRRDRKAQFSRRLEIDNHLEFGRLHHGQIRRLLPSSMRPT